MKLTQEQKVGYWIRERYEVVEPYPKMPFKVGDIISVFEDGGLNADLGSNTFMGLQGHLTKSDIEACPNIFRRMHWSELITNSTNEEILPDYFTDGVDMIKANVHNIKSCALSNMHFIDEYGHVEKYKSWQPATRAQYDQFHSKKNK